MDERRDQRHVASAGRWTGRRTAAAHASDFWVAAATRPQNWFRWNGVLNHLHRFDKANLDATKQRGATKKERECQLFVLEERSKAKVVKTSASSFRAHNPEQALSWHIQSGERHAKLRTLIKPA
ncbi:hypothetical protein SKAU_G00307470 [Synaphobranchus kaupii]|uniref:Uncharacterized protein n=1 Tax=Synaphobranchus kaupii TaxID=118154 RepID=A0A9Q1ER24_SYNKA|nr:hypothetical protein SKAU_G00307470 [Synaphobranchus kaupii]